MRYTRPGNCSGSYSTAARARAIALRSSSRPREVDATTFSIRYLAMGSLRGRPARRRGLTVPDTIGGLYASVRQNLGISVALLARRAGKTPSFLFLRWIR